MTEENKRFELIYLCDFRATISEEGNKGKQQTK